MLYYADGSALSRALASDAESVSWMRWADAHADQIVTSPLGLTELRRAADPLGPTARDAARQMAATLTVIRFFDRSLEYATLSAGVLPPFKAIHLGIAMAHPEVGAIATYDELLAQVASLQKVKVVTPGRPPHWWL
jgi:predicted nucleic acid-binding protein